MSERVPTATLLAELDSLSGGRIGRKADVGLLYEQAGILGREREFEEICFQAKFAHKAHGILQQKDAARGDTTQLEREFTVAVEQITGLSHLLLSEAPISVRKQFESAYLAATPDALHNLLQLCSDLSWYKNRQIDMGRNKKSPGHRRQNSNR